MKKLLGVFMAIVAAACATVADSGHPLTVRDESSGNPIPNAMVWFGWMRGVSNFPQGFVYCAHLEVRRTDTAGRVNIPERAGELPSLARAYAPGHKTAGRWDTVNSVLMLPSLEGSDEERFHHLARTTNTSCGAEDGSISNFAVVEVVVRQELERLAKTEKQREVARTIFAHPNGR